MAIQKGYFDETALSDGWFDQTQQAVGWWDADLLDTGAAPPATFNASWARGANQIIGGGIVGA